MVTMPEGLLKEVDGLARQRSLKRSRIVRQALQEWLERQQQQEFEALLAEGYQEMAAAAAAVVSDALATQVEAAEGTWRWDD